MVKWWRWRWRRGSAATVAVATAVKMEVARVEERAVEVRVVEEGVVEARWRSCGGGDGKEVKVKVAMVKANEAEERVVVAMVEARGAEERVVDKAAAATPFVPSRLYSFLAQGFKQFRLASRCARRSRRGCSTRP